MRERIGDGFFPAVVFTADFVLAAGFAGAGSLSAGVVDSIAFPNRGDRGGRSVGTFARDFLFAGACAARSPRGLIVSEMQRR